MFKIPRSWSPRRHGTRVVQAALFVTIIVLPLALGGAHATVNGVAAIVLLAAVGWLLWSRRAGETFPLGAVSITLLLAGGATLLQLLPLPPWMLAWVSPHEAALRASMPDAASGWAPLSLEPAATCHELIKLVVCLCGTLIAAKLFTSTVRIVRLYAAISTAGTAVVLLGFLQGVARIDRPYGSFGFAGAPFVSSFINTNHCAGFLGFAAFTTLGIMLRVYDRRRVVVVALAALIASGVFLTLSRAAILSLLGSGGLLALGIRFKGALHKPASRWVAAAVACLGLFMTWLMRHEVVHRLWTLSGPRGLHKGELWQPVPALLRDFGWTGIGPGALAVIYPSYQASDAASTTPYLENQLLQVLVDWGWGVGGVIIIALGLTLLMAWQRTRDKPVELAVHTGLVFLVVHNLADFNLALTAVALPAAVVLETLDLRRRGAAGGAPPWLDRRLVLSRRGGLRLAAAMAVVTAMAMGPALLHRLEDDTLEFARVVDPREPGGGAAAQALMCWHPFDYVLPLLLAERQMQAGSVALPEIMPYITRGIELAPHQYAGHLLAARAQWRSGALDRGIAAYRRACESASAMTTAVATEVAALSGVPTVVAALVSKVPEVTQSVLVYLLHHDATAAALSVLREPRFATLPHHALLTAEGRLNQRDYPAAIMAARTAQGLEPDNVLPYIYEASAQAGLDDVDAASATFERALRLTPDSHTVLVHWAGMLLARQRHEAARHLAELLVQRYADPPKTAMAHWLLGVVHERTAHYKEALREYSVARDRMPNQLDYRLAIARIHTAVGDRGAAVHELQEARTYLGNVREIQEALQKLQSHTPSVSDLPEAG